MLHGKMKKCIKVLGVLTFIILLTVLILQSCKLKQYENYYNSTEKLLDYIYNNDDSFMDTIGESDVYEEYSNAYIKLHN